LSQRTGYPAPQTNTDEAIQQLRAVVRRQPKALSTESSYVLWLRCDLTACRRFPGTLTSEQKLERFPSASQREPGCSTSVVPVSQPGEFNLTHWNSLLAVAHPHEHRLKPDELPLHPTRSVGLVADIFSSPMEPPAQLPITMTKPLLQIWQVVTSQQELNRPARAGSVLDDPPLLRCKNREWHNQEV